MAGFIEELYYGEINPQKGMFSKYIEASKAYEKLEEAENFFLENLQGELLKKFKEYIQTSDDCGSYSNAYYYKKGFRDGARFVNDVFSDD